jgi:DNA-binding HxlR family transcriptional regulator
MAGYGSFCPIALASEVFAERWTPLILREIVLAGSRRFSAIHQGVGRMSQSLLVERLRALEHAGVIERRSNPAGRGWEYHPTAAGRELHTVLDALGIWAQRWIELRREDCDPAYLMSAVHTMLRVDRLPAGRTVVRFDFREGLPTYWLVLTRERPELCFHDPGYDIDLVVGADLEALTRVFLGRLRLAAAVESGLVTIDGPPSLARGFADWLGLSRFAPYAAELRALTAAPPPVAAAG